MKKNLFLIAVATVVVAACSSDLDETSVVESCPVRLCTDGLTGMTRAGQGIQLTQFAGGQQVGIFLAEDNGGPVTSGDNVTTYGQPLTYVANGSGNLSNEQYWPQDGNGLHIYGVYPLAAATTAGAYNATGKTFSVQTDQTADANYMASDLMTGLPTAGNPVDRTPSAVPLTFTHLLTKIDVSLTAGSGFTTAEMANAVVSILGTKPTTTFNVQNATVGTASGDATTITAGTGASTSAIIVPQALAADASFIQVAVGGGNYIYKLPAAITFASSTKYTYNLTVTKTGLTLSGTTITPWTSVAPITGTAELLIPEPTDLSMVDCAGNDRASRWTANCYMVHTAGLYKLPLVYGNAIKNGEANAAAYTGVSGDNTTATFPNHAGIAIDAPWITKSTSGEGVDKGMGITVTSAALLWQDAQGLITKVGIDGDYLTLTVGKDAETQEGNALVAAKDADGNIVWSWHIWVTKQTFATLTSVNTGSYTYSVTPVNLGWVGDATSTTGYCTFYQWGRKDAFIPGTGTGEGYSAPDHTVYDINNETVSGISNTTDNSMTIDGNIQHPTVFYYNSTTKGPCNTKYYNMWDAQQTSTTNAAAATKKTVYDPCPPGFCVPTRGLYDYITSQDRPEWQSGYTYNGVFFPASGGRIGISGNLFMVGILGGYWSATPGNPNDDGAYGCEFVSNSTLWVLGNDDRGNGIPVRAVTE